MCTGLVIKQGRKGDAFACKQCLKTGYQIIVGSFEPQNQCANILINSIDFFPNQIGFGESSKFLGLSF